VFTETAAFYDAVYAWKDYAAESESVYREIEAAKRSPGRALLDVACGTGLHLSHLRKHYHVEGLDLDEGLLKFAQQRLPDVEFHVGNMVDFNLGRTYDVITCLFSSIGYVLTLENLHRTAANFARHLKPGGVAVVEPWLKPGVAMNHHISSLFIDQPDLKIARFAIAEVVENVSIFPFEYLIATPAGIERHFEHHQLGLFTVEETLEAFASAGLEVTHDPGGPMGRGLYVAVKPS